MRTPLLVIPCALIPLLLLGCDEERPVGRLAPGPAPAPIPAPGGPLYSPWVLELEGDAEGPFTEISFKDVGLSRRPDADRERVYEAIAMSLAQQIDADAELALESRVRYSEAMSDPSNHRSCAPRHVYVDLWEGRAPARWGYSLWSGCGEDDQFAWREVRRPPGDGSEAIASLTRSIAGSLREAVRTGCFTRAC
ncbi:MAG TPA: hypothetical protein RMH99_19040 [Sandaracinaceae bacterium LLY-WYZ-13_1]|nr:hypothetical protein [Sandaracinaceae bacterium LLY-WYZ-13_1]